MPNATVTKHPFGNVNTIKLTRNAGAIFRLDEVSTGRRSVIRCALSKLVNPLGSQGTPIIEEKRMLDQIDSKAGTQDRLAPSEFVLAAIRNRRSVGKMISDVPARARQGTATVSAHYCSGVGGENTGAMRPATGKVPSCRSAAPGASTQNRSYVLSSEASIPLMRAPGYS